MLLIPLRTDRRLTSLPWVNCTLILCNVIVYGLQQLIHDPIWRDLLLNPHAPSATQFISYQFLHGDLMHLLMNMIFLWAFGNNVENRLGKIGYLFFYLAGGTIAGIGHCLGEIAPVLGASGSVAAVTGAFIVLFPHTRTTLFYWLIIFGFFEISSVLLIGFQIAQNIYMQLTGNESHYAYIAHLSGYAYGIIIAWGLLWVKLLKHEPCDLMGMYLHRKRRVEFANMARAGVTPWDHSTANTPIPKAMSSNTPAPDDSQQQQINQLRTQVQQAISNHDLPLASKTYEQLSEISPKQIMSQQNQLDLANQFMADGKHQAAAHAYELFLHTYSSSSQLNQVQLLLGLIYTRYIQRHQRARELLTLAKRSVHDDNQQNLIASLLNEIGS